MRAKASILIVSAIIATSTLLAADSATAQQTNPPARDTSTHTTTAIVRGSDDALPTAHAAPRASLVAAKPNQNSEPGQAPDPANDPRFKADVIRLLEVTHFREEMVKGASDGFDELSAQLQDLLPDVPDKDKILDAYRRALIGMFQSSEMTDQIVAVYATYLSDDDVKGITQFFESPAGQHFKATEEDMNNNLANAVTQLGQQKVPEILGGLCTQFPELQGKVSFCTGDSEPRKSVMLDSVAPSRHVL